MGEATRGRPISERGIVGSGYWLAPQGYPQLHQIGLSRTRNYQGNPARRLLARHKIERFYRTNSAFVAPAARSVPALLTELFYRSPCINGAGLARRFIQGTKIV